MDTAPKKKSKLKIILIVIGVLLAIGIIGNALGGGNDDKPQENISQPSQSLDSKELPVIESISPSEEPTPTPDNKSDIFPSPEPTPSSAPSQEQKGTKGEENALKSAKQYLNISAFSYNGLIKQLKFVKYTNEEAVYGADNCEADWFEQAVKSAKSYLDFSAFSRDGLIQQLEFEGLLTNKQYTA